MLPRVLFNCTGTAAQTLNGIFWFSAIFLFIYIHQHFGVCYTFHIISYPKRLLQTESSAFLCVSQKIDSATKLDIEMFHDKSWCKSIYFVVKSSKFKVKSHKETLPRLPAWVFALLWVLAFSNWYRFNIHSLSFENTDKMKAVLQCVRHHQRARSTFSSSRTCFRNVRHGDNKRLLTVQTEGDFASAAPRASYERSRRRFDEASMCATPAESANRIPSPEIPRVDVVLTSVACWLVRPNIRRWFSGFVVY